MNEDYENNQNWYGDDYPCMPAKVLKIIAEIMAVAGLIAGLVCMGMETLIGILCIISGLYVGVQFWVLSLIVRVCYKYLGV